ncbi:hypothetical protein WA026_012097 [Henosepilachna vigintioctopunctata]|uniref:Lipase domain-containing protein n=1 Tax=Henosepilachna vigintioctopunctata TaxID=420089 RepID=A0AAW1V662_9CUCU
MFLIILLFYLAKVTTGQHDATDWSYGDILRVTSQNLQIRDGDVTPSDVNLYLYSRKNPDEPIWLNSNENYNVKLRHGTKIAIHGFLGNYQERFLIDIKNEFLKVNDFNIILVDWERVAKSYYISAARNTRLIGDIIADFLIRHKIPPTRLHLIGFSLGSHIAAFAAKKIKLLTSQQVERITGLDPAGPYFRMERITENERLSVNDAKIVDVVHTDGGIFGYLKPIGSLDMYVNGGVRKQPGCKDGEPSLNRKQMIINAMCSHKRSCEYFIESIAKANITCKMCDSYEDIAIEECQEDNTITIINQNVTESMQGICTFSTSESEPFLTI